jgi:hypothetical protein
MRNGYDPGAGFPVFLEAAIGTIVGISKSGTTSKMCP